MAWPCQTSCIPSPCQDLNLGNTGEIFPCSEAVSGPGPRGYRALGCILSEAGAHAFVPSATQSPELPWPPLLPNVAACGQTDALVFPAAQTPTHSPCVKCREVSLLYRGGGLLQFPGTSGKGWGWGQEREGKRGQETQRETEKLYRERRGPLGNQTPLSVNVKSHLSLASQLSLFIWKYGGNMCEF